MATILAPKWKCDPALFYLSHLALATQSVIAQIGKIAEVEFQ